MTRLLKYFNLLTAQSIVFVIFLILLVKLQLVISKTESQLIYEKYKAAYLEKNLNSLTLFADQQKKKDPIDVTHLHDSAVTPTRILNKTDNRFAIDSQNKTSIKQDTPTAISAPIILPRLDSVKRTFSFYGDYNVPIKINKLLSIVKVELVIAVSSYDSIYQYTKYLGLTKWKLSFLQRREGKASDEVAVFRIGKGKIDNNKIATCQFVEELPDHVFNQVARVVNFKGTISNSRIVGELSWIDRTDGGMVPVTIPVELSRTNE